jgi:hypothetical protein
MPPVEVAGGYGWWRHRRCHKHSKGPGRGRQGPIMRCIMPASHSHSRAVVVDLGGATPASSSAHSHSIRLRSAGSASHYEINRIQSSQS